MRAHYLQHVPFEGLGSIETWLTHRDAKLTCTRLFEKAEFPEIDSLDLLIVMGGPMSVNDERTLPWLVPEKKFVERALAAKVPTLGICLGAQLIANVMGSSVFPNREPEIGWHEIEPVAAVGTPFARIFDRKQLAFHWHGETFDLPSDAVHLARSAACEHQAFSVGDHALGLQFHLETTEASARGLIENCRNEIRNAPWIQSESEMLADPSRFGRINETMGRVLAALLQKRT
jgi:GMP synthase-like glutamine amidotransferase